MAKKSKKSGEPGEEDKEQAMPEGEENAVEAADEPEDDEKDIDLEDRKKDYAGLVKVKEQLGTIYNQIVRGFDDKADQNLAIDRAWDMYNCVLNEQQGYVGTSQIYIPLVRDAIEARVTRFSNQMFPQNGRYADVVGEGETPYDIIALLDYYVGASKLRSMVVPALMREGDCSGQYTVALDWSKRKRHVVKKVQKPETVSELGNAPAEEDTFEDIETEEIEDGRPDVVVVDARNLVVLPASVDEIEDAEITAVAMWLTKGRVQDYIDDEVFNKEAGEILLANWGQISTGSTQHPDSEKKAANQAGVKMDSKGSSRCLVYKAWAKVKVKGERRLMEMYFAGEDNFLSCKRLPFWNDRVPVLSHPALKVAGSFWGKSRASAVEKLQYQANDAVNMGMDSAQYALLPIVMTDPEKNPRIGSMVVAMSALWETNPNDTKFVNFPPLYKEALSIVAACKAQVMESMSTNPAMMPNANAGKKPSQAQVAQEQQVILETTADVVTLLEEGTLSRLMEWFYDLDYQFRDKPITLRKFGQMGLQADLQQIPLIQVGSHYEFRWNGTEANKSVQQVQQMIAAMNVLRGIPPEQLNGRKLDISPVLEHMAGVAFGARMAPKVLIDQRHQTQMPPDMENELMHSAFPVHVNPNDNDLEHIQSHQMAIKLGGDANGFLHQHIMEHLLQMKAKNAPQQPPGAQSTPGSPGGAGPGVPGAPGTPRIGAVPNGPRPGGQNPPGAVHQDQMPMSMPRKAI